MATKAKKHTVVFRSIDELKQRYLPGVAAEELGKAEGRETLGVATTLAKEVFVNTSDEITPSQP